MSKLNLKFNCKYNIHICTQFNCWCVCVCVCACVCLWLCVHESKTYIGNMLQFLLTAHNSAFQRLCKNIIWGNYIFFINSTNKSKKKYFHRVDVCLIQLGFQISFSYLRFFYAAINNLWCSCAVVVGKLNLY